MRWQRRRTSGERRLVVKGAQYWTKPRRCRWMIILEECHFTNRHVSCLGFPIPPSSLLPPSPPTFFPSISNRTITILLIDTNIRIEKLFRFFLFSSSSFRIDDTRATSENENFSASYSRITFKNVKERENIRFTPKRCGLTGIWIFPLFLLHLESMRI